MSWMMMGMSRSLSAASYAGPGNVLSPAYAWYSSARAYSAAFAAGGTAIMDLVDQAGANPITINILTTGFADVTAITNWVTANSVTTIKVAKLYDQTGNGRDVVQATLANMPGLTLNSTPTGTLPAVDFTIGTNPVLATTSTYTQAQPLAFSAVYIRTSGTAVGGVIGANANIIVGAGSGANLAYAASSGGTFTVAATDNSWHAINALLNGIGTSSAINLDGSDTLGNGGATGFSSNNIRVGRAAANGLVGRVAEAGIWATSTDSTSRGNLNSNQHGTSGYNF